MTPDIPCRIERHEAGVYHLDPPARQRVPQVQAQQPGIGNGVMEGPPAGRGSPDAEDPERPGRFDRAERIIPVVQPAQAGACFHRALPRAGNEDRVIAEKPFKVPVVPVRRGFAVARGRPVDPGIRDQDEREQRENGGGGRDGEPGSR
jgi:hypothetical protein